MRPQRHPNVFPYFSPVTGTRSHGFRRNSPSLRNFGKAGDLGFEHKRRRQRKGLVGNRMRLAVKICADRGSACQSPSIPLISPYFASIVGRNEGGTPVIDEHL
jgi:hypothetical protein